MYVWLTFNEVPRIQNYCNIAVCIIKQKGSEQERSKHFSHVLSVANSASKTRQCVRGTRFPFTLSSVPSLVKARTCARDPVQQHFFCIPYGVSTEAHVWHAYSTGAYQFNELPHINHNTFCWTFHAAVWLYYEVTFWIAFTHKLVTKNDFFPVYLTHINYHLFSCRQLNNNELKTLPSGIFSDLSFLRYL